MDCSLGEPQAMTLRTGEKSLGTTHIRTMITAFGKSIVTCNVSLLLALAVVFMCYEYDGQNGQRVILNEAPCCPGTDTYHTGILISSGRNRSVIQEK